MNFNWIKRFCISEVREVKQVYGPHSRRNWRYVYVGVEFWDKEEIEIQDFGKSKCNPEQAYYDAKDYAVEMRARKVEKVK